jgi:hypothetical protein
MRPGILVLKLLEPVSRARKEGKLLKIHYERKVILDITPTIDNKTLNIDVVEKNFDAAAKLTAERNVLPSRKVFWFELLLDLQAGHAHELDDIDIVKHIVKLIRKLTVDSNDAYDLYRIFMTFCTKVYGCYTTRGHRAVIKDSGGDYPHIIIEITYTG